MNKKKKSSKNTFQIKCRVRFLTPKTIVVVVVVVSGVRLIVGSIRWFIYFAMYHIHVRLYTQ